MKLAILKPVVVDQTPKETFTTDFLKWSKRPLIQFIIPPTIIFIIFMSTTASNLQPFIYFMIYFFMCFLWTCLRIGPIDMELYNISLKIRIKYEKLKSEGKNDEAEKYIKSVPRWLIRNCLIAESKCGPIFW